MALTSKYIKLVFGLKLKQYRLEKKLSLGELAKKSDLSVSYLNEIESGKKYPKQDKIAALANALGVPYDKLVSLKLNKKLAPIGELLESNILEQLPLDHYGIDIHKLIILLSNAPVQLNALISTLIEMARSSELSNNNFSKTALRTYKELNENYFEDIEQLVADFKREFHLNKTAQVSYNKLKKILTEKYSYKIDESVLEKEPELVSIRAIVIPGSPVKLLINKKLKPEQKLFILAKELGYLFMKIKERSYIYARRPLNSFDELLNNYRTSYFATSLIIDKEIFIKDIKSFFGKKFWDEKLLLKLIAKHNATPEMFFQRLTNIASKYLDLSGFFFLRFNKEIGENEIYLSKEMRLNIRQNPGGYNTNEHYCRRWISIGVLRRLENKIQNRKNFNENIVGIQISHFYETDEFFLTISVARPSTLLSNTLISITVGFLLDDKAKKIIKFWNDPKIKTVKVHDTCERCSIFDCKERVSPPKIVESKRNKEKIETAITKLFEEFGNR